MERASEIVHRLLVQELGWSMGIMMKLIQFYKQAFASLKGHWKVVLLILGVDIILTRTLIAFGVNPADLSFVPTNYLVKGGGLHLSTVLCLIMMVVCIPLFCRLPLFLTFGGISWRDKGVFKMGGKLILLFGINVAVHILLSLPGTFFADILFSLQKTESFREGGGLYYLYLLLLLASPLYYLVATLATTFTTLGYLLGSFWVVGEKVTLGAIFPKLWGIARRHKKDFWKYGGTLWKPVLLPRLAALLLLIPQAILLVSVKGMNATAVIGVTILFLPIGALFSILMCFTWPFLVAALYGGKQDENLQFLYFEQMESKPKEITAARSYEERLWGIFYDWYFTHCSIQSAHLFHENGLLTAEDLRVRGESYLEYLSSMMETLLEMEEDSPHRAVAVKAFFKNDEEAVHGLLKLASDPHEENRERVGELLCEGESLLPMVEDERRALLIIGGYSEEGATARIEEGREELVWVKETVVDTFTPEQALFLQQNPSISFFD